MDGMWDQRRRIVPRFFIWLFVPQPPVSTPPPSSSWLIQGCRQERKPRHNHACCHTSQRRGGAGRIIDDRGGSRLVGHRTTRSRDGLEIGTLSVIHGEWGADFAPSMRPHPGDFIVKGKSGLCGFESTNLDFLLRQKGISHVILAGFLTNCCVESTMRSAYEKGYKVYTLKDCTAATSVEAHEATIQHNFGMFSIPTTSDEIMTALTEYHRHPPL